MNKKKGITLKIIPALLVIAMVLTACGAPTETAAPATEAPATEAPATEALATEAPATEAPTEAPTEPASTEPIKIGMLTDLTGFTPWAVQVRDGMALAAQEINEAGGVDGRTIEIVSQDSENNAEIGVDRFERLVEEDVVAVGGIISSAVGAPVGAAAEQEQVPVFLVKSGTPAALTRASRYTFRTCLPAAPMVAAPVLQYAQ